MCERGFWQMSQSLRRLQFTLTTDGELGRARPSEGRVNALISDLKAPDGVPVLHVSAIDVELEFKAASRDYQQSLTQTLSLYSDTDVQKGVSGRLMDQGSTRPQDEGTVYHEAGVTQATSQALVALQKFFNTRPPAGARLCPPRMFRAPRLAQLAPGVFLPDLPRVVKPRQTLISAVARVLEAFSMRRSADMELADDDGPRTECSRNIKWYEERLWSCMISRLKMPVYTRKMTSSSRRNKVHQVTTDAHPDRWLPLPRPEEYNSAYRDERLSAAEQEDESDWLPLLEDEYRDVEGSMFYEESDPRDADDNLFYTSESDREELLDLLDSEAEFIKLSRHPADFYSTESSQLAHKGRAMKQQGQSAAVTQKSHTLSNLREIADNSPSFDLVGHYALTQPAYSTLPNPALDDEIMNEDILIPQDTVPIEVGTAGSNSSPKVAWPYLDEQLVASMDNCTRSNTSIQTSAERMSSSRCSPSLAEALDDDRFLWKLWRRRSSAAPPERNVMLEMQDMLVNDPDMRLLSSPMESLGSPDDGMLFDNFDWSRSSTQSSLAENWKSASQNPTAQEILPSRSTQSPQPTFETTAPHKAPTKMRRGKRKPVVSQISTPSAHMSEDDILFQQSSPTRQVDIKKRKA